MSAPKTKLGLFGFGAFGHLTAQHLKDHFDLVIYDPDSYARAKGNSLGFTMTSLEEAAGADIVVLAAPLCRMRETAVMIKPHLKEGAIVADVCSVKAPVAQILSEVLPPFVSIVGTHPLFGPRTVKDSLEGAKVALCPVRGYESAKAVARFLRMVLKLEVIETTADDHDREIAFVQGITHMVVRILRNLEPLPQRLTTKSFDQLAALVKALAATPDELFFTIERENPYARDIQKAFFTEVEALRRLLGEVE
ncbi:MAG: prephenate dehydrogenase [Alphaproteobacteria bacterium]|nr:prephenate dehydrogenase [Alphaproteobacteria bacterium]